MERWLPVAGYEGQYEVSDMGRVRGVARLTRHSHGGPERHRGKVLKPFARARKGYLYVALCKYAVHKQFSVHRLVALAFVPLDPGRLHVNHIDHDHLNNAATNLEWVTPKENTAAAIAAGKFAIAHAGGRTLAMNNPKRAKKLTPADIAEIRAACSTGERQVDIGRRYGITQAVVSKIKLGAIWSSTPRITSHQHQRHAA